MPLYRAILQRDGGRENCRDVGTFGTLTAYNDDASLQLCSLELPWRGNQRGMSCVPQGTYQCEWTMSPGRQEMTYRLKDVPGRDGILIHAGNFAGDTELGYVTDVRGCILLGMEYGELAVNKGGVGIQPALLNSRWAVNLLSSFFRNQAFVLDIRSGKWN